MGGEGVDKGVRILTFSESTIHGQILDCLDACISHSKQWEERKPILIYYIKTNEYVSFQTETRWVYKWK